MEKDKVSIIVPIYNVEQYIERGVRSLMAQDYHNIEIILVDDGSPDQSGAIIDSLANEDNRIKAIHKANGGVSSARNAGINAATGDYLMFVDGDDWVEPDYVSYFLGLIRKYDVSVAMNPINYTGRNDKVTADKDSIVPAEKVIEWIYNGKIFVAVWNKIYKAELFRKIKFSEDIWYGEGMLFNIECLQQVDAVAIGNRMVYHQTMNPKSAMRNFNLQSQYCGIASLWLQRAKWKKVNAKIEQEWQYHRYCFNQSIIAGLVRSGQLQDNKAVYHECVHDIRDKIFLALKCAKGARRKMVWLAYCICPKLIAKIQAYRFNNILKKRGGNLSLVPIRLNASSVEFGGAF